MIYAPTIPEFVRSLSKPVPYRTMFHRMINQHRRDKEEAHSKGKRFVPWLFRFGRGPWHVNKSILRNAHPEYFDAPSTQELDKRLSRVEGQVERIDSSHRDIVPVVRRIAVDVAELKRAASR